MQTITDLNLQTLLPNQSVPKALVRVDFNVPLDQDRQVIDNTRIQAALATIRSIIAQGGAVVLVSHLGRPKGQSNPALSLQHITGELARLLGQAIYFCEEAIGENAQTAVANLEKGDILLLENIRFYAAEKKADPQFAEQLAQLGCDIYVNDAFGAAHRSHASTHTIAQFFAPEKRFLGQLMATEIQNAQKILDQAQRPFTAILGGAKVSDKILLIESLLDTVNNLIIGGGMAYTFFKAMDGQIGNSLLETDKIDLAKTLITQAKAKGVQLLLPTDSTAASRFDNEADTQNCPSDQIPAGWMGLDIGTQAQSDFAEVIAASKTIFWNGPMGVFELSNFSQGTKKIAQAVAQATQNNGAFSLIGGGDSVSAIKQLDLQDQVSYVSTGGGAMLKFLEGTPLPALEVLK